MTTEPTAPAGPGTRRKRGHAAIGGRILAAGLSASGAIALVGAIGSSAPPTSATPEAPAPAAPTYVYVTVPSGTRYTSAPAPVAAAPAARPATKTKGS